VGHWSDQPDGFLVTALAGLSTQKIQYLLAHRPVPALLGVIAAADDMHCQPAPQQMLKGGEFARGEGPMKPPGSIACWWVTGPINPTAFW
jgi:hypothetical protein